MLLSFILLSLLAHLIPATSELFSFRQPVDLTRLAAIFRGFVLNTLVLDIQNGWILVHALVWSLAGCAGGWLGGKLGPTMTIMRTPVGVKDDR